MKKSPDRQKRRRKGRGGQRQRIVVSLHLVMMEDVKPPLESSALHGVEYAFRAIKAPDEQHAYEICVRPIGMDICSRPKASHFHGVGQAVVFVVDDVNVPETKEEKVY